MQTPDFRRGRAELVYLCLIGKIGKTTGRHPRAPDLTTIRRLRSPDLWENAMRPISVGGGGTDETVDEPQLGARVSQRRRVEFL